MDSATLPELNDDRPEYVRSRVTNGKDVLPGVDGRSLWVRRLKDVMAAYIAELGGERAVGEAQRSIIRRVGTQTVAIEMLEAQFAQEGGANEKSLDLHQRLSNTLRRNLEALRALKRPERQQKTIHGHLAAKRAAG